MGDNDPIRPRFLIVWPDEKLDKSSTVRSAIKNHKGDGFIVPNPLPYYRMYVSDFNSERVREMSLNAVGLYVLCLNHAWAHDGLPPERNRVLDILGLKKEARRQARKVWNEVAAHFQLIDGRLRNQRQEEERAKAIDLSAKRSEAALKRPANDQQTTSKRPANDQQTTSKRPANDQQTTSKRPANDQQTHVKPMETNGNAQAKGDISRTRTISRTREREMEAAPLGLFAEFWKRYRRLRDGAREQFVLQVWLSLDCEAHAAEIMESLGSYEKSSDVARGILMNGDTFLERLSTCGWKATWPAVMAQAAPGSGPQIVEQESKPLPFWAPPPAPQLTPEQDAANEREIDAMLASMSGGRRAS